MFFPCVFSGFPYGNVVVRPFTALVLLLESLLLGIGRVCALAGISSLDAQDPRERISLEFVFND